MANKLFSGRRHLNAELVDPPQLGLWVEEDLFPGFDNDELTDAGCSTQDTSATEVVVGQRKSYV